jgi:hypothetical protein
VRVNLSREHPMRNITQLSAVAVLAALSALVPVDASATATRTFVSGKGSDSNPCSLAAPCRTFAEAITQTASGGEITVLDSAGYGAFTIGQSVFITSPAGVEAAITADSGVAIAITGDVGVTLRGLTIISNGLGSYGIQFSGYGTLTVQNCLISSFQYAGIDFVPSGNSNLNVSDTIGFGGQYSGVSVAPTSGTTIAVFERVQMFSYGFAGISTGNESGGTVTAILSDSAMTDNYFGLWVAEGTFAVVNSRLVGNTIGIDGYQTGSVASLANTTISGNGTGYLVASGKIETFGNNFILDTNNQGSLTQIGQK